MVRKGVSLQEKRDRMYKICLEGLQPYNMKELEKMGSKKGVVTQTIKDVVTALVDDEIISGEKIGSGNYYWAFPSQAMLIRKNKIKENKQILAGLQCKKNVAQEKCDLLAPTKENDKAEREALEAALAIEEKREIELQHQLDLLKDNDPKTIEELNKRVKLSFDAANRWTDNIFQIKSHIVKKMGRTSKEVDAYIGIKDDFDYIE